MTKSIELTEEELQYALVMLTEGQEAITDSSAYRVYQSHKIQEGVIDKVRQKCWEFHQENTKNKAK